MKIELSKRADGSSVLKLTRRDGTSDWQKQTGPQANFFPLHDLTHYAVETELGIRNANAARYATQGGRIAPRRLSGDELAGIRRRRAALFAAWQELPAGHTLDLTFPDPD